MYIMYNVLSQMKEASTAQQTMLSMDYDTLSKNFNDIKNQLDKDISYMRKTFVYDKNLVQALNNPSLNTSGQNVKSNLLSVGKALGTAALAAGTVYTSTQDIGGTAQGDGRYNLGQIVSLGQQVLPGVQAAWQSGEGSDVNDTIKSQTGINKYIPYDQLL